MSLRTSTPNPSDGPYEPEVVNTNGESSFLNSNASVAYPGPNNGFNGFGSQQRLDMNGARKSFQPEPVAGLNGAKMYPNRVFVGGMSRETNIDDLRRFFSGYGNVKNVKIITDTEGQSKGYGFITFESEEEAKRVQSLANNSVLHERILHVGPAIKRNVVTNVLPIGSGTGTARPVAAPTNDQLLRFYSSIFPNIDPSLLYQPTMLPCYNFPLSFPFMYPSQNSSNQPF